MKTLLMKLVSTIWLVLSATVALAGGLEDYDYILQKYVKGDYVDYAAMVKNKQDIQRLDAFMEWQAKADLSQMERDDKIAFYINAYNSANIKAIVDNYPVHSPIDIPGYFDKLKFRVAGEDLTINEIEYDRLIAATKICERTSRWYVPTVAACHCAVSPGKASRFTQIWKPLAVSS